MLTKRVGTGDTMRFEAPTAGPQQLLGKTVSDDKGLVTALVNSPDFEFNVCRVAFGFVHGRNELACEGPLFGTPARLAAAESTLGIAPAAGSPSRP